MVPDTQLFGSIHIVLRQWGTIGLATASSISITVYVLLLGFLQRRRFEREAVQRGATLHDGPGMLDAALRLAAAAGIAVGIGLAVRAALLQSLPGVTLPAIFLRATVLCAIGGGIYLRRFKSEVQRCSIDDMAE